MFLTLALSKSRQTPTGLQNSFDTNIDLALDLDTTLWNTKLDGNHLAQVLLKLCVNARDAMSSEGGGIIKISTSNFVDLEGKEFVRIGVKDSGVGKDEGVLSKIFEPFFHDERTGEGDRSWTSHDLRNH